MDELLKLLISRVGVGTIECSQLTILLKGLDEKCEFGQKGISTERGESKPEMSQPYLRSKVCY